MVDNIDIMYRLPHGLGRCAVKDCPQMVQDHNEIGKKHKMCYFHAGCRDGRYARPCDYQSPRKGEPPVLEWDLEVG